MSFIYFSKRVKVAPRHFRKKSLKANKENFQLVLNLIKIEEKKVKKAFYKWNKIRFKTCFCCSFSVKLFSSFFYFPKLLWYLWNKEERNHKPKKVSSWLCDSSRKKRSFLWRHFFSSPSWCCCFFLKRLSYRTWIPQIVFLISISFFYVINVSWFFFDFFSFESITFFCFCGK